jgi:hypothetical protein
MLQFLYNLHPVVSLTMFCAYVIMVQSACELAKSLSKIVKG